MKLKIAITIGIFGFTLLTGCHRSNKEDEEDTAAANVRVPVLVTHLAEGNIESIVTAVGSTEAIRKEKVLSPIAGIIISLKVLEGSPVHTGDVIAVLRTRESQAAIEGAQALMQSAVTAREKEEARRAIELADSLQPQVPVRAAFDGLVATRNVTEGEMVGEQTELLTLIDPSTIVFIADVPVSDVAAIHPGLSARIGFHQLSGTDLSAIVDAVSPQADPQSQSVNVRLRFKALSSGQQQSLKANVPGTAHIITGTHRNVLLVRRSALLHDDESNIYSVVILTPDSLAKVVPVTVGVQNDSIAEIRSELLRADQEVIIRGQYALTDSTKVTVEQR